MLPVQLYIGLRALGKQAPPIRLCNYFVEERYHIKTENSPFSSINYTLLCVTHRGKNIKTWRSAELRGLAWHRATCIVHVQMRTGECGE